MRYTCEDCHYYNMDKEKDKKDCIMGQNTAKFYNDVTCCNYFIPIIEEEDQEEEPEEMPDKCPYIWKDILLLTQATSAIPRMKASLSNTGQKKTLIQLFVRTVGMAAFILAF